MTMEETRKATIKNWAEDDRPREKMMAHGAASLSKAELLAILVGSGIPGLSAVDMMRDILSDYDDSLTLLGRATIQDLTRYKGVGEAKAVTILAACQLANLRLKEGIGERRKMNSSRDAFDFFLPRMMDLTVEECHLLLLNNSLHIIGSVMLSHGGLAGASVDIRELLRQALLAQATAVVLCHNHPSGSLRASADDNHLTDKAQRACQAVGIRLLDHIIIGNGEYYSYTDDNKL